MSPDRWNEIKRLFDEAVDLPAAEQRAYLDAAGADDEVRREVEMMLAADETTVLDQSPVPSFAAAAQAMGGEPKIGRYRILHEVGRGGMGTVFAAVRDDGEFDHRVAVKIIQRGLNTSDIVRRFRHERQILASLEHPNIARLHDGGMSEDGLPFYVMEFIEGEPIDDYCRSRQLSVTDRLQLFRQVCAAVSYAHRRLIIHRDIKPGNILVTSDGTPKLLDFGIAKVISRGEAEAHATATQFGMMTPNYASPEQFRGEAVTTATDVYSLGVVLYELLTDSLPFNLSGLRLDEMLKVVCETEPGRPSDAATGRAGDTARREDAQTVPASPRPPLAASQLKGDLDNIILKALKKEPERRYESVEQFSEDIRRHLEGLPVSARADTFAYRASKFISRNKVGVLAASLVLLALVGGIIGTTWQAAAARRERERAEKRFEQVRKLANSVVFKYHDAIAGLPGATAAREMLVKDATEYLDHLAEDAEDNPTLLQELALAYLKIGNVQGETYRANLGDTEGALESYRKSVGILEGLVRDHPQTVEYRKNLHEASQSLTFLLVRQQRWQEAERMGQKVLDTGQALAAADPNNLEYQNLLARSYQIKGDTVEFSDGDEATTNWYRRSLEESEKIVERNPADERGRRILTVAMQRLGTRLEYYAEILKEKGEPETTLAALYAEAEQTHRRSVEMSEALLGDYPHNQVYSRFVAATSINLGTALARVGRGTEGLPYLMRSLETLNRIAESDPKNHEARRDIAEFWQYMAFARAAMNEPGEAVEANRRALRILEEITASDPSNFEFLKQTHLIYNNTGDILLRQGKLTEALAYYERGQAYVAKMSALNDSSQIAVLRSESDRKIGEAHLHLAKKYQAADAFNAAREHLAKARDELLALRQKNELGKNYEHKLTLIEQALTEIAGRNTP